MKKILLFLCLLPAVLVQAMTPLPNVGNGRIRVLGNNLQNYYYNYAESERPSYNTDEGRAEKTRKIVQMMLASNADIFAFCEVEAKPIVLQQLVDSLNKTAGVAYYATISDGINIATDSYDNALKSGFIYRSDKVTPLGSNYQASNATYYKNVMRIQAWTENATGESFTLSMNHFKAKTEASDIAKRVDNANDLMTALANSSKVKDPDVLIMGDLNCLMDEQAITIIQNGGYTEQLLRFNESSYSYCYQGTTSLIDHTFANSTMAEQITGAAVWHINTSCEYNNSATRYSDHDPYLVALNLGGEIEGSCTAISFSESFNTGLGQFEAINMTGTSTWKWNSDYTCAYINGYQTVPDEDWLVSPAFDFSSQKSGRISFQHAQGYGSSSNYPNQCKLLITSDYTGDVASTSWTQLEISNWSTSNYQWQDNTIVIPDAFMHKSDVRFAFLYDAESNAPVWEIKNLSVQTECENTQAVIMTSEEATPSARKEIRNGVLIIERNGAQYTITGQRVQ